MAGTLEQRVAALEQLVSSLQGSEALSPNYLTVGTDGTVSADFSGNLEVDDHISLPVIESPHLAPTSTQNIIWTDDGSPSGTPRAAVRTSAAATDPTVAPTLSLEALGAAISTTTLRLSAFLDADEIAYILTQASSLGPVYNSITAAAGGGGATIINGNGASSFLQLPSAQKRLLDVGVTTLTWSGGTDSNAVTVPHALGVVPSAVLAMQAGPGVARIPVIGASNLTTTDLRLFAECVSAQTGTVTVGWVAIA